MLRLSRNNTGKFEGQNAPADGTTAATRRFGRGAKILGAGAFLFFLVKGLVWLAIGGAAAAAVF